MEGFFVERVLESSRVLLSLGRILARLMRHRGVRTTWKSPQSAPLGSLGRSSSLTFMTVVAKRFDIIWSAGSGWCTWKFVANSP